MRLAYLLIPFKWLGLGGRMDIRDKTLSSWGAIGGWKGPWNGYLQGLHGTNRTNRTKRAKGRNEPKRNDEKGTGKHVPRLPVVPNRFEGGTGGPGAMFGSSHTESEEVLGGVGMCRV